MTAASARVLVVTSRSTPDKAWRPADSECFDIGAEAFEGDPTGGFALQLAQMIRLAKSIQSDHLWRVALNLNFTDEVMRRTTKDGGAVAAVAARSSMMGAAPMAATPCTVESHEEIKRHPERWAQLEPIGDIRPARAGGHVTELRNCGACHSTLGRRRPPEGLP